MPTYVYETLPAQTGTKAKQFEIRQSIKDPALTKHPESGEPIRRIITGGYGLVTGSSTSQGGGHTHTHTTSCGCGAGGCG